MKAMDVVNGKIVSARTDRSAVAEAWGALQPLPGRVVESMHGNSEQLRGNAGFSNERAPFNAWGGPGTAPCHGPPNSLGLEPSAARWNQRPSVQKHHSRPLHEFNGMQHRPVAEHRLGWGSQKRHFHLGPKPHPWSDSNSDHMTAMYEPLNTPAVSGHLPNACATSPLGPESPTLYISLQKPKECSLQRSLGSDAVASQESQIALFIPNLTLVGTSSDLKRKRSEMRISDFQVDYGCRDRLKEVLRKTLSLSDIGDLGRIIIPKKCAESQFQQIEAKEGTLLEMHDYDGSRRWYFRLKWWANNKSRMYVLEKTGEFIKYHDLKEDDIFIIYIDTSKNMVVRGQKEGPGLDSKLDVLQGANARSSADKSSSTKEQGPACSFYDCPSLRNSAKLP